jgi:hypothetical protein
MSFILFFIKGLKLLISYFIKKKKNKPFLMIKKNYLKEILSFLNLYDLINLIIKIIIKKNLCFLIFIF